MMLTCWIELLYSRNEELLKQKEKKMAAVRASGSTLEVMGTKKTEREMGARKGRGSPLRIWCICRRLGPLSVI